MPMLVVTDDELALELARLTVQATPISNESHNNQSNSDQLPEKVIDIKHGRGLNRKEVPTEIRNLVAQLAITGESHKDIAKEFNVSQSSISAYSAGATSTARIANNKDDELVRHNKEVKNRISDVAAERLERALASITAEKLDEAKVRDAAGIAKDMSVIMKNMTDGPVSVGMNQQVILYQPRMKEEQDYEVIEVSSY